MFSRTVALADERLPNRQIDAVWFDFGGVLSSSPLSEIKAWAVDSSLNTSSAASQQQEEIFNDV